MKIRLLLWLFCIGMAFQSFGQEEDSFELEQRKHTVFWNITPLIDFNGSSLQFGYNHQFKPWMDLQLELGFLSDDLIEYRFPFEEYAGFRIRPQVKFLSKNTLFSDVRPYAGVMLTYQHLTFKENKTFIIDDSFNQNISYKGNDSVYGWYLTGGIDINFSSRVFTNFSMAIGQIFIRTKVPDSSIPENATLIDDCALFCVGRTGLFDSNFNRASALFDLKFGYRF